APEAAAAPPKPGLLGRLTRKQPAEAGEEEARSSFMSRMRKERHIEAESHTVETEAMRQAQREAEEKAKAAQEAEATRRKEAELAARQKAEADARERE